ncbi:MULTISPECIES: tyrosine-type recombinase/integrase [Marinovum]|uniref:tyrosine-type recombinase/integrase n=1 Tax=Marinovum TaxID=367771 RepID=UPI00237B1505|nr:site-specific integrase [Marinovum sp. PR37]MDD9746769.1 site-specific integrase [Marinovum sp. PR37]
MASFRKLKSGKVNVQIRKAAQPHKSKSFDTMEAARAWVALQDSPTTSRKARLTEPTLLSIGRRYCDTQLKGKPSRHLMLGRIERIAKHFPQPFLRITRSDVNKYKTKRLSDVSGPTVREEIQTINKLFRWAEREMLFGEDPINSPAGNIALPPASKPRSRIVERNELDCLMTALNPLMAEIVELAYETAMRRAEITKLIPRHLRLDERLLAVEDGKTGDRVVPLTTRAVELLSEALKRSRTDTARLYPVAPHSISTAIRRARQKTGLPDHVRMHQMRHTRITEVARRGFNQAQIMMVSGHRDTRSVQRYTHLSVKDVIDLLE